MEVKGIAIRSTLKFIELNFPDMYRVWLDSLEEDVRRVFTKGVLVSKWYDVDKYLRHPVEKAAEVLHYDKLELAWELGIFSSQQSLNGIYRFFLRFGGPRAMIKRVPFFLETYYRPSTIRVLYIDELKNEAKVEFINFVPIDDIVIYRVMGWGHNTLLASGAKNVELKLEDIGQVNTYNLLILWE